MVTYIIIQHFLCVFFLKLCSTFISCLRSSEEGVGSPGTDITDGCKLPFLESQLAPLQELPMLLILTTEPSLQYLISCMFIRKSKQRLTSYLYSHHLSNMAENSDYGNRKESLCLYSNLLYILLKLVSSTCYLKRSFLRSNS